MAVQQPVEDGRERPYVTAIHAFELARHEDVGGRDKPGHDESEALQAGISSARSLPSFPMGRGPKDLRPNGLHAAAAWC
jgi:hypothetical protein